MTVKTSSFLSKYHIGQRVLYSGTSNYSYWTGKDHQSLHNVQSREPATVIQINEHSIVLKIDKITGKHKKHRTKSDLAEYDAIDVLPIEHYAFVSDTDLIIGEKKIIIIK